MAAQRSALAGAYEVLHEAGEPLHVTEITRRMLARALWESKGKTPAATVNARIAVDIKQLGEQSRFVRVEPGVFGLRG